MIVGPNTPKITTLLKNTGADKVKGGIGANADTDISDGGIVSSGTVVFDTASLSAQSPDATGTATYYFKEVSSDPNSTPSPAVCDNASATVIDSDPGAGTDAAVAADGTVGDSGLVTLTQPGVYEFWVVYSGNADNDGATSGCGTETVRVKSSPSISTLLKNTGADKVKGGSGTGADTDITDGGLVSSGTVVYDTATLKTGQSGDATGTATYYFKKVSTDPNSTPSPAVCDNATATIIDSNGAATGNDAAVAANGTVGDSGLVTLTQPGVYEFWVVYSGNSQNEGATSGCGTETVRVKNAPTISTLLKNTGTDHVKGGTGTGADTDITDGGLVPVGTVVFDTASLTGQSGDATGTATYYFKKVSTDPNSTPSPAVCDNATATVIDSNGAAAGNDASVAANGTVGDSGLVTLTEQGVYEFWVVYSGNGQNEGATSGCGTETVRVNNPVTSQITPTQTTCQMFKDGATPSTELQYTVNKQGKIGTVSPGVLFYWIKVTAGAGPDSFTIAQDTLKTDTTQHPFDFYFGLANGSFVYNSSCVKFTASVTQSGANTTISFDGVAGQTYFIGIKYDPGTIKSQTAPNPATVVYKFSIRDGSGIRAEREPGQEGLSGRSSQRGPAKAGPSCYADPVRRGGTKPPRGTSSSLRASRSFRGSCSRTRRASPCTRRCRRRSATGSCHRPGRNRRSGSPSVRRRGLPRRSAIVDPVSVQILLAPDGDHRVLPVREPRRRERITVPGDE